MILLKEKEGESHRGEYFNLMRAKQKHLQYSNIIIVFMSEKVHCWAASWSNTPLWSCGPCCKARGCCPCPRFHFWKLYSSDATTLTDGPRRYGGGSLRIGPASRSPENNGSMQVVIRGRKSVIRIPAHVLNKVHRGAWN